MTIPHRPISWYLGLSEDGQIIPITSPCPCRPVVNALAHLRSSLSREAGARITTGSQQRPKEMIPKRRSDTKYPLRTRAVGCLFSQTPPLPLTADAEINLLRCHRGARRGASGKGGGVGVGEGEGFCSLCKQPVSPLTSLTGGIQLKKKKIQLKKKKTHGCPASLEKLLRSPRSFVAAVGC